MMGVSTSDRRGERGFTLIEVMVAAVVLMVGVLSTLALIDRANATTALDASREQANSLERDLVEGARSITYPDLASSTLNAKLQAIPGLANVGTGTRYKIARRGVTYTVTDSVCIMDDANDGGGSRPNGLNFCAQSVAANTNSPVTGKPDKNPEDYKLVALTVSWKRNGVTRRVTQTAAVNNPGSATGPSVTSLVPSGWAAPFEITTDPAAVTISIGTSSRATTVSWSIDGTTQAATPTASDGTGLAWTVPWSIHPSGSTALDDGPYLIEALAYNQYGVSGPGLSQTITLNRFPPRTPTHVAGGRNASGGVDIEWDANTERDIIGYQVSRADGTVVCALAAQGLTTTCTDPSPPSGSDIKYNVYAYDKAPTTGTPRASTAATLDVFNTDTPPYPPLSLAASNSGGVTTLTWTRPSPSDPDAGDSISFYRIYRDGTDVSSRYDRWYASGSSVSWQDTHTGGAQHTYWISAVDTRYGESTLVGPVTG
jgi:Tfp pilus assembly protein PilE